MNLLRRTLRLGLAGALVFGASLVGAPTAAVASVGQITVGASDADGREVQVTALPSFTGLLPDEYLEVEDLGWAIYVRVKSDSTQDGVGRDLLTAASPCYSPVVGTVLCAASAQFLQVRADMTATSGYVQWVMLEDWVNRTSLVYKGGSGVDEVYASKGDDYILGGDGADLIFGGAGDDFLSGGPGNDQIEGESGRDDMRGDSGSDSIDAADNLADVRVDCGGLPKFLDFDKDLDNPTNCGANPTPIPPAPVEPTDPPAPGEGEGTVDGVPVDVEVAPKTEDDTKSVTINTGPTNPITQSSLWWFGTPSTPPVPTFPPFPTFDMTISELWPSSIFDVLIFGGVPGPIPGPVHARTGLQRSGALETVSLKADANGVAQGKIPVPAGQEPGNYTLQLNGVTAAGAQMTVNVGVRLDQATPKPDPEPEESITITAKRGKGKQAKVITVRGTTTGLEGTAVTPRYRVQGAKRWTSGTPVRVADAGTFTWKVTTPKKVRIQVISGAVKSHGVVVAAVKK